MTETMIRRLKPSHNFNSKVGEANGGLELCRRSLRKKAPILSLMNIDEVDQNFQFKLPSYDPIWERFSDEYETWKAKALRSKLFYGGGTDMISIWTLIRMELIDHEGKIGTLKNTDFCPSVFDSFRCQLWMSIIRNWLGENLGSWACFEEGELFVRIKCFGARAEVQKRAFQDDEDASSTLARQPDLAKYGL
ncbi:unnamed protein product [Linum trigynum]|uniref:Calpain catalytic domain-containing protein n=1 Tax=Linum trigynum TaxID=586398 RepID=A0AAV2GVN1_9ROSI